MSNPQQLRYTVDITGEDIDAIQAFLTAMTAEQLVAHRPDATEHRMANAVEFMLSSVVSDARRVMQRLADPEETDRYGGKLSLQHGLKNAWNLLVSAATPWRSTPGYDTVRWQRIIHTDATYVPFNERDRAKKRAARAARQAVGQ